MTLCWLSRCLLQAYHMIFDFHMWLRGLSVARSGFSIRAKFSERAHNFWSKGDFPTVCQELWETRAPSMKTFRNRVSAGFVPFLRGFCASKDIAWGGVREAPARSCTLGGDLWRGLPCCHLLSRYMTFRTDPRPDPLSSAQSGPVAGHCSVGSSHMHWPPTSTPSPTVLRMAITVARLGWRIQVPPGCSRAAGALDNQPAGGSWTTTGTRGAPLLSVVMEAAWQQTSLPRREGGL